MLISQPTIWRETQTNHKTTIFGVCVQLNPPLLSPHLTPLLLLYTIINNTLWRWRAQCGWRDQGIWAMDSREAAKGEFLFLEKQMRGAPILPGLREGGIRWAWLHSNRRGTIPGAKQHSTSGTKKMSLLMTRS